jgi:large subunit ribosomal protein L29
MAIEKLKDLSSLSIDDLKADIKSTEVVYQKMLFEHSVKGLDDPLELRVVRRNIARINTELRRREIEAMSPSELALRSRKLSRRQKGK